MISLLRSTDQRWTSTHMLRRTNSRVFDRWIHHQRPQTHHLPWLCFYVKPTSMELFCFNQIPLLSPHQHFPFPFIASLQKLNLCVIPFPPSSPCPILNTTSSLGMLAMSSKMSLIYLTTSLISLYPLVL